MSSTNIVGHCAFEEIGIAKNPIKNRIDTTDRLAFSNNFWVVTISDIVVGIVKICIEK